MPSLDADYYALLRLAPSADAATIRAAWAVEQRLWGVRQNAPDLATRHAAERHVELLGEVKDVLLDPRRRAAYDRERRHAPTVTPRGDLRDVTVRDYRATATRPTGIVKPLGIGLAGAVISGSQIFHWDFAVMLAIVFLLSLPVYAFDMLGLRSGAWIFRTRTRGLVSWVLLVALTLGFGLSVVLHV